MDANVYYDMCECVCFIERAILRPSMMKSVGGKTGKSHDLRFDSKSSLVYMMAISWDLRMLNFCLCDLFLVASTAALCLSPSPLFRSLRHHCHAAVFHSAAASALARHHFHLILIAIVAMVLRVCKNCAAKTPHDKVCASSPNEHYIDCFAIACASFHSGVCGLHSAPRAAAWSLSPIFFLCFSRGYQTLFASYFE